MTATPRERTQATDPTVRPALSAREREVLNELARGATYADIAAELFVSRTPSRRTSPASTASSRSPAAARRSRSPATCTSCDAPDGSEGATRFGRGSSPERGDTMKTHPSGGSIEHVRRAA